MEKLKLSTPNLTEQNIARIAELFPNVVTEAKGADGKLKRSIDFDTLKQELSDHIVEGPQERYHLNWPGKRQAMLAANAPINKTLRPVREESVNFDTTRNLFIEGDNLDALKLLQETYLGKVKMIYIDPPYNTGKDFIYKDNFTVGKEEYEEQSGQRDEEGGRLVANPESNGRFHSDWLSMIYPRLKLARNLLSDGGSIFISIDDNEHSNLREICDEIFGADNFVNSIAVKLSEATGVKMSHAKSRLPKTKEHILFYRRTSFIAIEPPRVELEAWNHEYRNLILGMTRDELDKCKELMQSDVSSTSDVKLLNTLVRNASITSLADYFASTNISDVQAQEKFRWDNAWRIVQAVGAGSLKEIALTSRVEGQELSAVLSSRGNLSLIVNDFNVESRDPRIRLLFADSYLTFNPGDFWSDIKTSGGVALEGGVPFPNGKKPLKLVRRLVDLLPASNDTDIILDFFAGSATTAEAVLKSNSISTVNRKFILVQFPEHIDPNDRDAKQTYELCEKIGLKPNVCEVGKERIRRAGAKILAEHPDQKGKLDIGIRVLKIDSGNMADVVHAPDQVQQKDLINHISNIKPGRTGEDLLFQVLLDWGVDITLPIARESIEGKEVFFVDGTVLAACFETGVNETLVKQMAARKPLRVVFRDDGFDSDDTRINTEQWFKHLSPTTEVKVI